MRSALLPALLLPMFGAAQTPDTSIKVDLRLHYRTPEGTTPTVRWYDSFGEHSKLSVELNMPLGFRVRVTERLQKIDGSPDAEQLEEYYVEDPGAWRLGKQRMPFGRGLLLKEYVVGARGDTSLLIGSLPVSGMVFDNGRAKARGASARIGRGLGVSMAIGENLGAQATSRAAVRDIELVSSGGQGYSQVYGVDFSRRLSPLWAVSAEGAAFRKGATALDPDAEVTTLLLSYEPKRDTGFKLGWARDWRSADDYIHAQASLLIYKNAFVEPFVRFRGTRPFDAGVSLRVKL